MIKERPRGAITRPGPDHGSYPMIDMKSSVFLGLFLAVGCSSETINFGEGAAGAGGQVADAGEEAVSEAGDAGDADVSPVACTSGEQIDCACYGEPGHKTCTGSSFGVCRNKTINACCGAPDGWPGCGYTGCGVCTETLTQFPKYTLNHPNCFIASGCVLGSYGIPDAYGACSASCPKPTAVDK